MGEGMMQDILLIEPSETVCTSIKWTLFHEGFRFTEATTESDIQTALHHISFKLVIADCTWIYQNQWPLSEWLSKSSKNVQTSFLFLVDTHQFSYYEQWLLLSGFDYILKPVRAPELLFRVQKTFKKTSPKLLLFMPPIETNDLTHALSEEGFSAFQAATKPEALDILSAHKPEVVVIDAGVSFSIIQDILTSLHASETYHPFTFLCASPAELAHSSQLLTVRTDDIFLKPILAKDFILRLKRILGKSKQPPSVRHFTPFPGSVPKQPFSA